MAGGTGAIFFLAVMPSFCFLFVVLDKKHGWFEGGVVLPSRKLTYPPDKAYLKMITTFSPGGICDRSLGGYLLLKKNPLEQRWRICLEHFVSEAGSFLDSAALIHGSKAVDVCVENSPPHSK